MPDLRDLGFMKAERQEAARPMLEHGLIANTPIDPNQPVGVILPEFADDQIWGPYRWQHNGADIPQAGDDCLVAFSNRREGWIIAFWSGVYAPGESDLVTSVFARIGDVVAATGDYTVAQVTGAAPLASPTFTGTPAAPTAAVDTNTTQLATTAFVLGQLSAAGDGTPGMDGAAARGTSTHFARADHIHPTDTSRAPLANPVFTGDPQAPTPATSDNDTSIATTAFVQTLIGATGAGTGPGLVPTGALTAFAGAAAPTGWLLCQGQAVSRTTYSALFAVIGSTYGAGDGSTTFNLPNLQGRVAMGAGTATGAAGATAHSLGAIGGEETHQITIAELASHTHVFTGTALGTHSHASTATFTGTLMAAHTHSDSAGTPAGTIVQSNLGGSMYHNHSQFNVGTQATGFQAPTDALIPDAHTHTFTGTAMAAHTHSDSAGTPAGTVAMTNPSVSAGTPAGTNANTGSDTPHNNLPPFTVVNYIIKT